MSTRIRIDNVRFNFTNTLFTAKAGTEAGSKEKFSVVSIIEKNHPQLAAIKAAIREAAVNKWSAKADDILKSLQASDRLCLHDGDGKSEHPGYAGKFYINASNEMRPGVFGPNREPLVVGDGKPYSGSYGNVILEMWAQDNKYGKRVNASLLGAQYIKDGDRLSGGGVAAADDFEAIAPLPEAKAASGAAGLF